MLHSGGLGLVDWDPTTVPTTSGSVSSFDPGDEPITDNIDGVGTFFIKKDRVCRKRRREFQALCKSQKAKIVRAAYSVLESVCETFCPNERMALLDAVLTSHKAYRARLYPSYHEAAVATSGGGEAREDEAASLTHQAWRGGAGPASPGDAGDGGRGTREQQQPPGRRQQWQ